MSEKKSSDYNRHTAPKPCSHSGMGSLTRQDTSHGQHPIQGAGGVGREGCPSSPPGGSGPSPQRSLCRGAGLRGRQVKRVPHPAEKESQIIQLSALLLGGSGWRAADKSSFVPGSGAGKPAERHPHLHPAAPFIHALPSTPPQLEEKQLCKGPLSPGQLSPPEVASWEERSPFSLPQVPLKYHGLWVPTLGFPFTLCTTVFNSLVPSSTEDLGPSPSLLSKAEKPRFRTGMNLFPLPLFTQLSSSFSEAK